MLSIVTRIRTCAQLNRVRFVTKQKAVVAPAKKDTLLKSMTNENTATLSEESLPAKTNYYTIIGRFFNPFVLRTYGELQQEHEHPALNHFRSTTDQILHNIVNSKTLHGQLYKNTSKITSVARRSIGSNFSDTVRMLRSDKEQQYVASVLAITIPASEPMWKEYDQGMVKLLNIDKICSIDTGLLAYHALWSTGPELRMRSNWKTPIALMNLILRRRKQLVQEKIQANVFDFAAECNQFATKKATLPANTESSSLNGESKTRDSKELERLGLIMQLLATPAISVPKGAQESSAFHLVGQDATEYGVKVLTTLRGPAPISALKVVWTHAPRCNLPNSYLFYKTFFEQVLRSLVADPLQLVGDEVAVVSLLESMVASKFKSTAIIVKLFEILAQGGFDYQRIGLKMFGTLVELNAMSFANSILNSWVESSDISFDSMAGSTRDSRLIGEKGMEMICEVLVRKTSYTYGDLAIVVINCGRVEQTSKVHLKNLRDVEAAMTKEIANLPLHKVISLLRIYTNTGRNYPPIVEQLCEVVNLNVDKMSVPSLNDALWAAARLNLRNASFVNTAVVRVLDSITEISELYNRKADEMIRLLWTLSVLRKLDLATFATAKSLIEQFVSSGHRLQNPDLNHWAVAQLSQVWVEAQTLMREQGMGEQEWLLKNTDNRGNGKISDNKVQALPWHSGKVFVSDTNDITSSRTHLDLSKTLKKMGVPHENEVQLSNGYVADLFIPIKELEEIPSDEEGTAAASKVENPEYRYAYAGRWQDIMKQEHDTYSGADDYEVSFKDCKGVVVEFDGPSHFESYARKEMGTTVMKRRHIKSAGYKMVNIPFWRYAIELTADTQEQVVKTYLQKSGLRVKQK